VPEAKGLTAKARAKRQSAHAVGPPRGDHRVLGCVFDVPTSANLPRGLASKRF
jgi:hypothetical protein